MGLYSLVHIGVAVVHTQDEILRRSRIYLAQGPLPALDTEGGVSGPVKTEVDLIGRGHSFQVVGGRNIRSADTLTQFSVSDIIPS